MKLGKAPRDLKQYWKHDSIEGHAYRLTGEVKTRDLQTHCKDLSIDPVSLMGKRILDLGAGIGAAFARECNTLAEVVSLSPDFSLDKYRAEVKGVPNTVAGIGQMLPFKKACFDLVIAFHVTEHVNSEIMGMIAAEGVRVLERGGSMYIGPLIEEPGIRNDLTAIQQAVSNLNVRIFSEKNGARTRFTHPLFDDRRVWTDQYRMIIKNKKRP